MMEENKQYLSNDISSQSGEDQNEDMGFLQKKRFKLYQKAK